MTQEKEIYKCNIYNNIVGILHSGISNLFVVDNQWN